MDKDDLACLMRRPIAIVIQNGNNHLWIRMTWPAWWEGLLPLSYKTVIIICGWIWHVLPVNSEKEDTSFRKRMICGWAQCVGRFMFIIICILHSYTSIHNTNPTYLQDKNYANDNPHSIVYLHLTGLFSMECTGHTTHGWRVKGHYPISVQPKRWWKATNIIQNWRCPSLLQTCTLEVLEFAFMKICFNFKHEECNKKETQF